jgi:hypothetical protein
LNEFDHEIEFEHINDTGGCCDDHEEGRWEVWWWGGGEGGGGVLATMVIVNILYNVCPFPQRFWLMSACTANHGKRGPPIFVYPALDARRDGDRVIGIAYASDPSRDNYT